MKLMQELLTRVKEADQHGELNVPASGDLEKLVHDALDTATSDNGYSFDGMSPAGIATDLISFDAELEDCDVADLLPHIKSWLKKNGKLKEAEEKKFKVGQKVKAKGRRGVVTGFYGGLIAVNHGDGDHDEDDEQYEPTEVEDDADSSSGAVATTTTESRHRVGHRISEAKESFSDLLDEFCDQKKIYNFEGRRGVVGLAKLCRAIGYHDKDHFGQLDRSASIGDIVAFFEDNSGALEAVVEWIKDTGSHNSEWQDSLSSEVGGDEEGEDVKESVQGADAVIDKLYKEITASGIKTTKSDVRAVFIGGSSGGMDRLVRDLEKELKFDSAGAWTENSAFYKKMGITKANYNALVKASL